MFSNPSSYAYLDTIRPGGAAPASCATYDNSPYGVQKRGGYTAPISDDQYVNEKHGTHHTVTVVPLCGHNARSMFTAEAALRLIF